MVCCLIGGRVDPSVSNPRAFSPEIEYPVIGSCISSCDVVREITIPKPVIRFVAHDRDKAYRRARIAHVTSLDVRGDRDHPMVRGPEERWREGHLEAGRRVVDHRYFLSGGG